MTIAENINLVQKFIPNHVRMVAVSKMQPVSTIMEAYDAGQRAFGENKVQELVSKQSQLPPDVEWHFIGHLQTNKVKYLASFVRLIHSIDNIALLKEVNKEAARHNRIIDCLLQFHIAIEETKFGLDIHQAKELLKSEHYKTMKNIRITGVMGMGSYIDNLEVVRREFKMLHDHFMLLKHEYFENGSTFNVISMGMTGDYIVAIEEGSTLVRIGTAIFNHQQ